MRSWACAQHPGLCQATVYCMSDGSKAFGAGQLGVIISHRTCKLSACRIAMVPSCPMPAHTLASAQTAETSLQKTWLAHTRHQDLRRARHPQLRQRRQLRREHLLAPQVQRRRVHPARNTRRVHGGRCVAKVCWQRRLRQRPRWKVAGATVAVRTEPHVARCDLRLVGLAEGRVHGLCAASLRLRKGDAKGAAALTQLPLVGPESGVAAGAGGGAGGGGGVPLGA